MNIADQTGHRFWSGANFTKPWRTQYPCRNILHLMLMLAVWGWSALGAAVEYAYKVYPPEVANWQSQKKTWPLVIYLHGKGESGEDLAILERHGPPLLIKEGLFPLKPREFFIAAPQSPKSMGIWVPAAVEKLRQTLIASYPINPKQVGLTGQSFGGIGVFYTLSQYPKSYRAAVAICGRGKKEWVKPLIDKPLWVFHGSRDHVVPVTGSREMVYEIKALGGTKVKYDELLNEGHMIHNQVYQRADVWTFLLGNKPGKTLGNNKKKS